MENRIKIAIIGFGKRGKTHLRNYEKIKEEKSYKKFFCNYKKIKP